MWYKDVTDKDGKPTGERTTTTAYSEGSDYLCGNAIPDLYGGFGTSVSFFGFDFGINFNYQIGGKIYDSGHVPFKEKDQVYTDYRATIDKIFTYLNVDSSQRRLDSFKNNLKEISGSG